MSKQLNQGLKEIGDRFKRSQNSQMVLEQRQATCPKDLLQALLEIKPHVVHLHEHVPEFYSASLAQTPNSLLEGTALANLFELFAENINCVLVTASQFEEQAELISHHINYVVGIDSTMEEVATEFSLAFYNALLVGESVEFAYRLGCQAIALSGNQATVTPTLKIKSRPQVCETQALATQEASTSSSLEVTSSSESDEISRLETVGARFFISYRSQDPDQSLARQFYTTLRASGHEVFMAAESIQLGDNWSQRIDQELEQCDYFVLLLSPKSAISEMVTEEVRRAKELHDSSADQRPVILPIRVNFPMSSPLNYDLRGYLNRIQQREWRSPDDSPEILQEILNVVKGREMAQILPADEISPVTLVFDPLTCPPGPIAEPELPGGQVDLASQFYIDRPPVEMHGYETIVKPGALIRIKAPRQMGKTSLMSRILAYADQQGCLTVPLSFQLADTAIFSELDKFLRWFCSSIGRRLRLPNRITDYWDDIFGSKDNCTTYFEEYILTQTQAPIVLGLDEVDCVFQHPEIATDFFGLLRAWHEDAKTRNLWKKLRLIVVHSTEIYIPLNINQSPFNVGLPIELSEFTLEQVYNLAQRHGLTWNLSHVTQLMNMVGGHPYLVRVALYQVARQELTFEQLLLTAPTEAGPYSDHLRRHLWNLEQNPGMAAAMKQTVASTKPVRLDSVQAFQLHSMGLVHLQNNEVVPRCDLYRHYFRDRLHIAL
ncbi:MAG: AAA-like domain-containing protein [Oculatellaceae cyanobacterium bins.114]|nr:AAA-like domain-containing protein [Oculatellaceae cyanobacterium bins.114]